MSGASRRSEDRMLRSQLITIAAAASLFLAAPAGAKPSTPIYFKGYDAGSATNSSFSFDGDDGGGLNTDYGFDTIGGPNLNQGITEYADSGKSCTASDGTVGEILDLVDALEVNTYFNGGQIFYFSDSASECVSLTTGVYTGTVKYSIVGGSGKFTGASGSGTADVMGLVVAPTAPGSGFFGSFQESLCGTFTP
jgi:hypothetical protein